MDWFERAALSGPAASIYNRLLEERLIWDLSLPAHRQVLRKDVARIADDMDDPGRMPPMFWSGIPWPEEAGPAPSCGYQLVISVGGTKTEFAFLRMDKGRLHGLDPATGKEVTGPEEIERIKNAAQMPTPKCTPQVPTGAVLVANMVRHFAKHFGRHKEALEGCEAVVMSWGFPHRVFRTAPSLAGGLTARVTLMTKDQAGFSGGLVGKDINVLFDREFRSQMGWSRPIAVANDTVMALHWFLDPERRRGHNRVGLFINGTGVNFSAAEAYAVRSQGYMSGDGETYEPARITVHRKLASGEREGLFFVNYEAGSLHLEATRTRFDTDPDYPFERNVLAGGNAFPQQLRAFTETFISKAVYERIRENWIVAGRKGEEALPGAPVVSSLATGPAAREILKGFEACEVLAPQLRLVARAVVARSALHAAMVLAAVTVRTGFGRGREGLPDLLGMEGSVWKIPGYQDLVRSYWQDLTGDIPLKVDFAAEPAYNASLSGPLYLAAIQK